MHLIVFKNDLKVVIIALIMILELEWQTAVMGMTTTQLNFLGVVMDVIVPPSEPYFYTFHFYTNTPRKFKQR